MLPAAASLPIRFAALTLLLSIPLTGLAEVKVAFIGDQGTGIDAQAVLQLVAAEEADILLIQGDLGYDDGAAESWENNLDQFLGEDFPVLSVVGNHENFEWPAYQTLITDRIDGVSELNCEGNYGVKSLCSFRELEVVQIAPGVSEVDGVSPDDDYAEYIVD